MSMPARLEEPWMLYAGDDAALDLTLTAGGAPLSLEGFEVRCAWRESRTAARQVELDVEVTDAAAGKLRISVGHDDTAVEGGRIRSGVFDVQTVSGQGIVRTLLVGTVKWRKDVTR